MHTSFSRFNFLIIITIIVKQPIKVTEWLGDKMILMKFLVYQWYITHFTFILELRTTKREAVAMMCHLCVFKMVFKWSVNVPSNYFFFFDSAKTEVTTTAIVNAITSFQLYNICITFVYYVYYAVRCLMLGCLDAWILVINKFICHWITT